MATAVAMQLRLSKHLSRYAAHMYISKFAGNPGNPASTVQTTREHRKRRGAGEGAGEGAGGYSRRCTYRMVLKGPC